MTKLLVWTALAALCVSGQTYQIDSSHSAASFSVKHMMVTNVTGKFANVKGTVTYDERNLEKSSISATVGVATVNTNDAKRDDHLRTPDFFHVAKYPTMSFKSTRFYKEGAVLKIDGNLTLHGVTRLVTLTVAEVSPEVKHPMGTIVRGATAQTMIHRKDYGLTWNKIIESGGMMVSDEVNVTLEIELSRKPG